MQIVMRCLIKVYETTEIYENYILNWNDSNLKFIPRFCKIIKQQRKTSIHLVIKRRNEYDSRF